MSICFSSKTTKPKDSTLDLDDLAVSLVPPQPSPIIQTEASLPSASKPPYRTYPSIPTKDPPNLMQDEDHAWETFKGIVTNREVRACYNRSMRDFERSTVHDLFKV